MGQGSGGTEVKVVSYLGVLNFLDFSGPEDAEWDGNMGQKNGKGKRGKEGKRACRLNRKMGR